MKHGSNISHLFRFIDMMLSNCVYLQMMIQSDNTLARLHLDPRTMNSILSSLTFSHLSAIQVFMLTMYPSMFFRALPSVSSGKNVE